VIAVHFQFIDEFVFFQSINEFAHVAFCNDAAHVELVTDSIDNRRFVSSVLEKFEDSRSDEIEVEHLPLPDIEDDCSVLAVCAAHCVGDPVHLKPHLVDVWAHCDTPGCLKPEKNEIFR